MTTRTWQYWEFGENDIKELVELLVSNDDPVRIYVIGTNLGQLFVTAGLFDSDEFIRAITPALTDHPEIKVVDCTPHFDSANVFDGGALTVTLK